MNIWTLITRRQFKATHFQTFRVDNTEEYMVNILSWTKTKYRTAISSVLDWNRTLHLVEEFGHHASACLGMLSGCSCCCTLPSVPSGLSSRKALCQSTTSSGLYAVCFTRKSTWKTRQEIVFRTITKAFFFPPQIVPACFLVHCSSYIFRLSPGASPSNNVHEG